jgi:hypothetical protein
MEGHTAPTSPTPFPIAADLRGLLEYIAERLEAGGPGDWRLELSFTDGHFRRLYIHQGPITASALASAQVSR